MITDGPRILTQRASNFLTFDQRFVDVDRSSNHAWLHANVGGDAYCNVALTNKGTGPAVIERFDVSYQGQPAYNWTESIF